MSSRSLMIFSSKALAFHCLKASLARRMELNFRFYQHIAVTMDLKQMLELHNSPLNQTRLSHLAKRLKKIRHKRTFLSKEKGKPKLNKHLLLLSNQSKVKIIRMPKVNYHHRKLPRLLYKKTHPTTQFTLSTCSLKSYETNQRPNESLDLTWRTSRS